MSKFYNEFKDAPHEVPRGEAFRMGQALGLSTAQKLHLKGSDANAIATLVNEILGKMKYGAPVVVEGSKAVLRQGYYCPIMVSAMSLKLPWEWLDRNFAWPWMEGIASIANPSVKLSVIRARYRGDAICEHVFEIE
jgi:hypothetical protein